MSAWIEYRRDRVKYVKNLGWLMRLDLSRHPIENMVVEREPSRPNTHDVRLTVYVRWGHSSDRYGERVKFTAIFADSSVLHGHFLDRPRFQGIGVNWMGKPMAVGSEVYRALVRNQVTHIVGE